MGSEDKGDTESYVVPSSSSAPDAITHQWYVKSMEAILLEGMQPNEWGKPTRYIYEEPRVISYGVSRVPSLHDTIISYGLIWLIESLGRYSPVLVRSFMYLT